MHSNLRLNGTDCFRQHLEEIVSAVRGAGAEPVLLTQAYLKHADFGPPDEASERFEEAFQIGLQEHGEVVRDVARRLGVPLVDLDRDFPLLRRHFTDPIHMTETGNAAKARLIADVVLPVLAPR
jgi:lysophospholipase L1-like esterase